LAQEAARPAAEPAQPAAAEPASEESVRPGTNAQFLAPDLDLAHWIKTFEGESREIAVERDAITAAIGLRPGLAVADIGSGTGLFLGPLSAGVGETGKVFAVELAPGFVEHLRKRVADEGLANVEVVPCTDRSVELAPDSIDVAFVCDTYHHFEYPRTVLASLRSALRSGGSLVLVDFERIEGVSRAWVLDHVRAGKEATIAEIRAAGFGPPEEIEVAGLVENYVLRFPESP
jgi:SAM-dependent methyltransferase